MPPVMRAHPVNAEGRIMELWEAYLGHCLAGRWDSARSTMEMIDQRLERIVRRESAGVHPTSTY